MVRLHAELGASGLEILAFPCNQFGNQEPQAARDVEAPVDDGIVLLESALPGQSSTGASDSAQRAAAGDAS